MPEIEEIAIQAAKPIAYELGMVGIVSVLSIGLFGYLFWRMFSHLTDMHKEERKEWRDADKEARKETNKVLSDLKDVIRMSNNLSGS